MEDKNLNQGLRETADELPGSDCGELSDEEADAVAGGRGASAVRGTSAASDASAARGAVGSLGSPYRLNYKCVFCGSEVESYGPVYE